MGVSRATAHKWLRRFREQGPADLEDRSSAPHRCPHALPARDVRRIVAARRRLKRGPHQLAPVLGHPRSTIFAVLRRRGLSQLTFMDRPTAIPIRYERERPGELVHIDVKKLPRVPAGGGHKMHGRANVPGSKAYHGDGYDSIHVAVDDRSRWAYVEVHANERGSTCAGFLRRTAEHLASVGVKIEAVMTDRALNYVVSEDFRDSLAAIEAQHI